MPDEHLITLEPYALLYTRAGAGVCLRDPLTGKVGVIFMELTDGMALERCLNGERPGTAGHVFPAGSLFIRHGMPGEAGAYQRPQG